MSMLLDLGLFLRENNVIKIDKKTGEKIIIPISSAIRGFLYTIACRVGSDPYSWVSQETLAEEMDMTIDGIKKLSRKSVDTSLIESIPNPSDKRKRMYRPAKFLVNYTQKRREKLSTGDGLGTIFEPKKVDKRTPNKSGKVDKRTPSRCTNVHRNSEKKEDIPDKNHGLTKQENVLKGHESTITSKQPENSRKERGLISESFYPSQENQKLADKTASSTGKTGMYLIRKFIEVMKKYNVKENDFNERFRNFLLTEMPVRKAYKSGTNKISAYL